MVRLVPNQIARRELWTVSKKYIYIYIGEPLRAPWESMLGFLFCRGTAAVRIYINKFFLLIAYGL